MDDAEAIGAAIRQFPQNGQWYPLPEYGIRVRVWPTGKIDAEWARPSWTCADCGMTTYSPQDIRNE